MIIEMALSHENNTGKLIQGYIFYIGTERLWILCGKN